MAEKSNEPVGKSGIAVWLKTIAASLAGVISGAVVMYATHVVDSVIKPAKPIANFQAQTNGLNVAFQNRSTGGHEGWWDFGDASALEPFVPDQAAVSHTYPKPGSYTVKLSLKNLIGEQNDRAVNVVVDQGSSSGPTIDTLDVVATHGDYAPATYRVVSTVHNANLCVWAVGNRPLEFSSEMANGNQERLVTFKEPGNHTVKLAAHNGKQAVEKTVTVAVKKAPAGLMTATIDLNYDAVFVEQRVENRNVLLNFPIEIKGNLAKVSAPIAATAGFEIVKAELSPLTLKNPSFKSPKLEIDPAKHDKAVVSCELPRPPAGQASPAYLVQVTLTERRQSAPMTKTAEPLSVNLTVPGSTRIPLPTLPPGWVARSHKLTLTLQQEGKQTGWKEGELPHNAPVRLSPSAAYTVNAVEESGQLRIDVAEVQRSWSVFGN